VVYGLAVASMSAAPPPPLMPPWRRHLVFGRIADMVVKMLLAAQPHLARAYSDAVGSTEGGVR